MAKPASSLVTLRPEIMATLEEWPVEAQMNGFVGPLVLPVFDVPEQSGNYGKIDREEMLKTAPALRAAGGGYQRLDLKFDDASYATKEYGFEAKVDDRRARMYRNYFDAEKMAAKQVQYALMLKYEKRVQALVSGNAAGTAATNAWSDAANGTPITDVIARKKNIWSTTGLKANTMVITYSKLQDLLLNDEVIDRSKSQGFMDVRIEQLAEALNAMSSVFDLNVLIAESLENTADEGQTASLSSIWTDSEAIVMHANLSGGFESPSFGYTLQWDQDGMAAGSVLMEGYRDESVRADIIRGRHETDELLVMADAANKITGV